MWFAGNAVITDLQQSWGLAEQSVGYVTSAVQLGFIIGTLVFAFLAIADRFSPRRVFFFCSVAGAIANISLLIAPEGLTGLLILRFTTGFFLAGIYPVGMKIAAGWYEKGLGRALGYLVGALVLGTAFPHLLRGLGAELPWQQVMVGVSILAICGGMLMFWFVPDGPHLPKGSAFNPRTLTFNIPLTVLPSFRLRLLWSHVGTVYPVGIYPGLVACLYRKFQFSDKCFLLVLRDHCGLDSSGVPQEA